MIIDTSQGNIEVIGDIKEFKTSIDPKNLEFITTLLSSNLYSDPEQSFIREIVSNAWDSHVEAGNTDTPVIVRFKDQNYNKSVTIRDYGTGLSPERFAEVYCNIGSSTKRDSNEFIGGFGIGKYSSLACSNTVYITSYYNGIAYYYVMVKSGNSITTNLLREQPTTEKNGVEITVRNIVNFSPYEKALDYIVFFPNVYIDGIDHYLNSAKLKRLTHIAIASRTIHHKLLLGNVLYPCNRRLLPTDVADFLQDIHSTGIVVKFDIGELGITPNRENIIYTSDTIDKISTRVREAKKELLGLVRKHICKDYQNLEEYLRIVKEKLYYDPVTDSINTRYNGYSVYREDIENMGITYKGVDLKDSIPTISCAFGLTFPNYKAVISEDKVYTKKLTNRLIGWDCIKAKKVLICKHNPRLVASIKAYLRDKYDGYTIVGDLTKDQVEAYLSSNVYELEPKRGHANRDLIIDGVWESILSKSKIIDFDTDPDYAAFKADLAANKVVVSTEIKEAILYKYDHRFCVRDAKSFKRFSEAIKYLKSLKQGVIIANTDEDEHFWTSVAHIKGFTFFKARKDVVSEIRALNLSCVVDMGWLLREDPLLNKVHTVHECFPNGISGEAVDELRYTLDEKLFNEFKALLVYYNLDSIYVRHCKVAGTTDPHTKYLCERLKSYLSKWGEAKSVIGEGQSSLYRVLTAAVVMKTSSYRISARAYSDVKRNKLLRVLCRK